LVQTGANNHLATVAGEVELPTRRKIQEGRRGKRRRGEEGEFLRFH